MSSSLSGNTQPLEDAFLQFNEVSQTLAASYQLLENRVGRLNDELAAARSERLQQLAETERLANRLTNLLEALPAGVVVVDAQDTVHECNPAARLLLEGIEPGMKWCGVKARTLSPQEGDDHEFSLADGRRVTIAVQQLGGDRGKIILLTDVTETHSLQELVHRNQRLSAMGEMAASLAHQIRTPLAAALLYASHLNREPLPDPVRRQIPGKIIARLRHMEKQVNDMLTYARGGPASLGDLAVTDWLQEFQHAVEPHLHAGALEMELPSDIQGCAIRGNRDALLGILMNLAVNAQQNGANNLHLAVDAHAGTGGCLELRFSDDGNGIKPANIDRIFDPFFTTRAEGTGLGLAVVQSVIQAHGGSVALESTGDDGTTFVLRFPVLHGNESVAGTEWVENGAQAQ